MTYTELVSLKLSFETMLADLLRLARWGASETGHFPEVIDWSGATGRLMCDRFLDQYAAHVKSPLAAAKERWFDWLLVGLRIEYVRTFAWFDEPRAVLPAGAGAILADKGTPPSKIVVSRQNKTITIDENVHYLRSDELAVYLDVLWKEREWLSDREVSMRLAETPDSAFSGTRWDQVVRKILREDFPVVFDLLETHQTKGTRFKR